MSVSPPVTVSLGEIPKPDQELLDKYTALKDSFYKRLSIYFNKAKVALEPLAEQIPHNEEAKEYVENLQAKPQVQAAVKVGT